jgi:glycerol kinase
MTTFLLGIDQGSSGSRAVIMDPAGQIRGYGYRPLARLHPRPDWVEQDPHALSTGVAEAITAALTNARCRPAEIAACGLAVQRNTDFVWDARTGRPLANGISWQDLRTVPMLAELEQWPHAADRRRRLGYFPGPYSSALHLGWRMRHDEAVREAARAGQLRLGFSGNWILTALGRPAGYWMDYSLVQQMGLYDFRAGQYWAEWLDLLQIPADCLPGVVPTVHHFGDIRLTAANGESAEVPVLAMIGNEQAALFGHQCYHPGDAECSHGTASFVDVVTGHTAPEQEKLNVYYAWSFLRNQETNHVTLNTQNSKLKTQNSKLKTQNSKLEHTYCLEADTTVSGAALRWMKEQARLFDDYAEVGPLAASVADSGGVVFVPAFTGLNVPHNDPTARGAIFGLTLGSSRAHIIRAFLESLGYQIRGILDTITAETGLPIERMSTGGGIAASDEACQIQADLTGIPTVRPAFTELAARAAALLAGMGLGLWPSPQDLPPLPGVPTIFEPRLPASEREAGYARWLDAVARAGHWGSADRVQ